jgi:DNA-binding MarR family transcriptional regulator
MVEAPEKASPMPLPRQPIFPPLTVSRAALLQGGSDDAFREVIQDLVDYSFRLAQIRETLARQVGLTPPQYRLLMELAHWSQSKPTVGEIAEALNVSLPFITTETRRLAAAGLVRKIGNAEDRRRVDLSLTDKGSAVIETLAPMQRAVNDTLFKEFSGADMKALGRFARALLDASQEGLALAKRPVQKPRSQRSRLKPPGRTLSSK